MAVGSGRSTLGSEIEKNRRDFDNLPSMIAIKLDCKLVQSLDVFSCFFCPLCQQGAGRLFEFIFFSDLDLKQDSRQSSYVILHDM